MSQLTAQILADLEWNAANDDATNFAATNFGQQAIRALSRTQANFPFAGRSDILALAEALAKLANPDARITFDR